jgi:hypothetical protein
MTCKEAEGFPIAAAGQGDREPTAHGRRLSQAHRRRGRTHRCNADAAAGTRRDNASMRRHWRPSCARDAPCRTPCGVAPLASCQEVCASVGRRALGFLCWRRGSRCGAGAMLKHLWAVGPKSRARGDEQRQGRRAGLAVQPRVQRCAAQPRAAGLWRLGRASELLTFSTYAFLDFFSPSSSSKKCRQCHKLKKSKDRS